MAKLSLNVLSLIVAAVLTLSFTSCSGPESMSSPPASSKTTYKCLSSSCDATVTCNEGDPVPDHCGKRMIR